MPHLLVCSRTADFDGPVLPAGAQHEACTRCQSVVIFLAPLAAERLQCMLQGQPTAVLCLACAALEDPRVRELYCALYGREPEDARRTPAIQ